MNKLLHGVRSISGPTVLADLVLGMRDVYHH